MRRWDKEEDAALRRLYPVHGALWDGWADVLPDRSTSGIYRHANKLRLRKGRGRNSRWTVEENAAVAEHYPTHGASWDGWDELLEGRTRSSIAAHATIMGISKNCHGPWARSEVAALREHYPKHGPSWDGWAEVLPGRTENAIKQAARHHGVRCRRGRKPLVRSIGEDGMRAVARHVSELSEELGVTRRQVVTIMASIDDAASRRELGIQRGDGAEPTSARGEDE